MDEKTPTRKIDFGSVEHLLEGVEKVQSVAAAIGNIANSFSRCLEEIKAEISRLNDII